MAPEAPEAAGFGKCAECAYKRTGTASICYGCAQGTIEPVAIGACPICDQLVGENGKCRNRLCNEPPEIRGWSFVYAIAMRSGELKAAINRYKYADKYGWAVIFGRVLAGFLEEGPRAADWDLIIGMPTYTGEGAPRGGDHIDAIMRRAIVEAPHLPFRRDVMLKTQLTPTLVSQPSFVARAITAELHLRKALEVANPAAVKGKSVLVFDDVFTSGLTLREVARKLRAAGATEVAGVVLARQPYGRLIGS